MPESPELAEFPALLAEMLAQHGRQVLLVQSRPASSDCHPLFQWDASRPLASQVTSTAERHLLLAPHCKAGDRVIVEAAAGNFDVVIFGGDYWQEAEVTLDSGAPQTLILLMSEMQADAGYALVKGLHEIPVQLEILMAGKGAHHVAQAAFRFLKMPFSAADTLEQVWHIRHASAQTSSNTLSTGPDLPLYVARILNRRDGEASFKNHARTK
jgi:hypothetical protein